LPAVKFAATGPIGSGSVKAASKKTSESVECVVKGRLPAGVWLVEREAAYVFLPPVGRVE